ncbi:unnamed protein product [Closterium sp. Yama58-4]|nr:unnamed protein product [Closterium sp. Yama58-4]
MVSQVEGGGGIVDAARMDVDTHGVRLGRVRLRATLRPEVGDKLTSRHGQKGVIGRVLPSHDLPWFDGVARIYIAYCGVTGQEMEGRVFVGPTHYLRLKHLAADKRATRAIGTKQGACIIHLPTSLRFHHIPSFIILPNTQQATTRQPTKGRAQQGGMRVGEMERDCLVAHGAAHSLSERLSLLSDATAVAVCSACCLIASAAGASGGGLGAGGDGVYGAAGATAAAGGFGGFGGEGSGRHGSVCQSCGSSTNTTEVCMPYSLKLLFEEMRAMGISVRLQPSHC